MNPTYRLAAVSYLNTIPFLHGLVYHPVGKIIEIIKDYPSRIADLLIKNKVDISLMPVAALIDVPQYKIITNYCIGCKGPVATVQLFANEKLDVLHTIHVDYQSLTSIALLRMLLRDYWKKDLKIIPLRKGHEQLIPSYEGILLIGDRATYALKNYKYAYDLGEAWMNWTRLPFVFAAWTTHKDLNIEFLSDFNDAMHLGLSERNHIASQYAYFNNNKFNVHDYFFNKLSYELDEPKKEGMHVFLNKLKELPPMNLESDVEKIKIT